MSNDTVQCRRCGTDIEWNTDEWWRHSWHEEPSEENIEKALEADEFRDWFRENIILCPSCHKDVVEVVMND